MSFQSIETYLDAQEAKLDQFISTGTEHELFLSSYIHGHFSVQAAAVVSQPFSSVEQAIQTFESGLYNSIKQALDSKELDAQDAQDVLKMFKGLFK